MVVKLESQSDAKLDPPCIESRSKAERLAWTEARISVASKGSDHIRSNRVVDGLVVEIVKKVERLTHDFDSAPIPNRDGTRQAEIQSPEAGPNTGVSPGTDGPVRC